jgi:hypothetical protein
MAKANKRRKPKRRRRAKHPASAGRGKPGSGAEPMLVATGVASAAVKRRKASASRRMRCRARPVRVATSGWRRGQWTACAFRRFASLSRRMILFRKPVTTFRDHARFVAWVECSETRDRHCSFLVVPGFRGACHRAGHFGPDPLAQSGLRALQNSDAWKRREEKRHCEERERRSNPGSPPVLDCFACARNDGGGENGFRFSTLPPNSGVPEFGKIQSDRSRKYPTSVEGEGRRDASAARRGGVRGDAGISKRALRAFTPTRHTSCGDLPPSRRR